MARRARYLPLPLLALTPGLADAGNGVHPRTPVLWEWTDEAVAPGETPTSETTVPPCITVVDRSQDPVLHVPYRIPYEDTNVTKDEVDDSRRHQFLALRGTGRTLDDPTPPECPWMHPQATLPNWVTSADVRAASEKGLIGPAGPGYKSPDPLQPCCGIAPDDVLEVGDIWDGCWTRITGDDERRPITFEMASQGVNWDTTDAPAGTYTIHGYTWEPLFNLWSPRFGVVKVVDDADPANSAPALHIITTDDADPIYYEDQKPSFDLCVDAMDGSTVTVSWALAESDPSWSALAEDEPVSTGLNTIVTDLPPDIAGESFIVRADITDPQDRTLSVFFDETVIVLPGDAPGGGGGGAADSVGDRSPHDADPAPPKPKKKEGSGCRIGHGSAPAALWLLPLLVARRRP